jgi:hypothetical protein
MVWRVLMDFKVLSAPYTVLLNEGKTLNRKLTEPDGSILKIAAVPLFSAALKENGK